MGFHYLDNYLPVAGRGPSFLHCHIFHQKIWAEVNCRLVITSGGESRGGYSRMLHAPTIASSAFLGLLTLNYLLNLSWVFVADRSALSSLILSLYKHLN